MEKKVDSIEGAGTHSPGSTFSDDIQSKQCLLPEKQSAGELVETPDCDDCDTPPPLTHETKPISHRDLPPVLEEIGVLFPEKQDKKIVLLSVMTCLSGCFPKVYGVYNRKEYDLNLYVIVVGPAGSGKSIAGWGRRALQLIEQSYIQKGMVLFLPPDTSSAALVQLLIKNQERGIFFSTEIDSLSQHLRKEWGQISPLLRQAYEHESYDLARKGNTPDGVLLYIKKPCISMFLTGTIGQISALIPGVEDGLFSRVGFYLMEVDERWRDVFGVSDTPGGNYSIDQMMKPIQERLYKVFQNVEGDSRDRIQFKLTHEQEKELNDYFAKMSKKYYGLDNEDSLAIIRRQGLVCFKLAGILTVLRQEEAIQGPLVCKDSDFKRALRMADMFIGNALCIAERLKDKKAYLLNHRRRKFLEDLPQSFSRKKAIALAVTLGTDKDRTVDKDLEILVAKGFLIHIGYNQYQKFTQKT